MKKLFQTLLFCISWFPFFSFAQTDLQKSTIQINFLLDRSSLLIYKNADSAVLYAREAKQISQKIKNDTLFARSVHAEALSNTLADDYFAADTGYKKAVELFRQLKDTARQANALSDWGLNYHHQSNYEKAVEMYLKTLKLHQKQNKAVEIARVYVNLGIVYKRMNNYEKALDYYQKAKTIFETQKQEDFLGIVLNNIGIIYRDMQQFDKAISTFQHALQLSTKNPNHNTAGVYNGLATVFKKKNELDSALFYYKKALYLFEQNNSTNKIGAVTINLANLYLEKKEFQKALEYAKKGFQIVERIQNKEYLQNAHKTLADIYAAQNNFEKGFFHQKEYQHIRDSLFNEESKNELAKMQVRFGNQQKEYENELLKKENQQKTFQIEQEKRFNQILLVSIIVVTLLLGFVGLLFYKNQKKKLLLQTKNNAIQTLLSELHHRVKNNLQIIGSLLSIQARRLEEPTAKNAIQDVQSRIRTMTLIHEKLYQSDLLTEVELDEYVKELQEFLFRLYNKSNQIEAIICIPKTRISVDKAIPLGLILNEWITNSLKYAFPNPQLNENMRNIISISLERKENNYTIIYRDNGIGMQNETKNNEKDSTNLSVKKKKKSMGTQLVFSLIEQLNATQNVHFEKQGVKFELILPL